MPLQNEMDTQTNALKLKPQIDRLMGAFAWEAQEWFIKCLLQTETTSGLSNGCMDLVVEVID